MKIENGYWLINLRWIAALGVVIATLLSTHILEIPLPQLELYSVAIILFIANSIYLSIYHRKIKLYQNNITSTIRRFLFIQIIIDLILLTILLHFSGGIENPFIVYYTFHLIIASILLPRFESYIVATITVMLAGILAMVEYIGIISHYQLSVFFSRGYYDNVYYITGGGFIFLTTSFVIVYLTNTISNQLRKKGQAYRQVNSKLISKDQIKNEYVYQITHDLKGHLGAIKNCLDVVLIKNSKVLNTEFTERALNRTRKLHTFMHDLNGITQLQLSYKLAFEKLLVRELIDKAIDLFNNEEKEKKIIFDVQINPQVKFIYGNKLLLTEVFKNLLSNSIKYSSNSVKINIHINSKDEKIRIEIKDTGIGIPENEIQNIFNEFYRASNANSLDKKSNGLGLTLVKLIVEHHKGQIFAESKVNEGTSMTLILPA